MGQGSDDEQVGEWIMFLILGFLNSALGSAFLAIESMSNIASVAFYVSAVFFFIVAILKRSGH